MLTAIPITANKIRIQRIVTKKYPLINMVSHTISTELILICMGIDLSS